ncbi:hypothetical protein QBC46DRAFT_384268 [Diplogelasinospora grovesii]|uniref:Ribosomal protein bL31m N-terminal domain-containing protein n=1 Tax=Diplogelasinospora grovesii TaxID=303347 RepID=A0AAN6N7W4_9PEZI|nr:hypothetical protein QBC46DRAFT_384268 [Diplogelasinospora grovesii]
MGARLPTSALRRPSLIPTSSSPSTSTPSPSSLVRNSVQTRNATFVPRPRRPYMFTQLVQLSDGSTFTVRTTSPTALYKSTKDSRNHLLWQPSEKSLRNVELDEAGKLAAFRERFGRGWDLDAKQPTEETTPPITAPQPAAPSSQTTTPAATATQPAQLEEAEEAEDPFDSMTDLISAYAKHDDKLAPQKEEKKLADSKGKGGKGKKK